MKQNKISRDAKRTLDIKDLLSRNSPVFESFYIPEPQILFGSGVPLANPKVGISTFGPYNNSSQTSKTIRIAVIGTGAGIQASREYLQKCLKTVRPGLNRREKYYDPICFPDFPGLDPEKGFRTNFVISCWRDIPNGKFEYAAKHVKDSERLKAVVDLIDVQIEMIKATEPVPDIILIVLPKSVEDTCSSIGSPFTKKRKLSIFERLIRSFQKEKAARKPQLSLDLEFEQPIQEQSEAFWNLHHAIKAHAMRHSIPTQIVWESTLKEKNKAQDPATIAWNLFTAIYYKANNIPWQLKEFPENTCFVGISFYKSDPANPTLQVSLAQAFSGRGEGLVLQGPKTLVDQRGKPIPHLSEREAEQLLRKVLEMYSAYHDMPPHRVVIHKTSRYWKDELKGFRQALNGIARYDLVAIETMGNRFFRMGKKPPLRGTVIKLTEKHYVLYTTGYIPELSEYPGMRIPMPIEIIEHYGESPIDIICEEILALTKINWNSCSFSCREPITIQFSRSVGKILRELPADIRNNPQRLYRFYM